MAAAVPAQEAALYRGRSGKAWLQALIEARDAESSRQASLAIGALSKVDEALALRCMEVARSTSDRRVRRALTWCMQGAHAAVVPDLIRFLSHADREVVGNAARSLGAIGPEARSAIPALIATARQRGERWRGPLFEVTPGMVPHLGRALRDEDAWIRKSAADLLGNFHPEIATVVPHLLVALTDDDAEVRKARQARTTQERRARP